MVYATSSIFRGSVTVRLCMIPRLAPLVPATTVTVAAKLLLSHQRQARWPLLMKHMHAQLSPPRPTLRPRADPDAVMRHAPACEER